MTVKVRTTDNPNLLAIDLGIGGEIVQTVYINREEADELTEQLISLLNRKNITEEWTVADCHTITRSSTHGLIDGELKLQQTVTSCLFRRGHEGYELVVSVDEYGAEYNLYDTLTDELLCDEQEDELNQYYKIFQRLCYLYNEELIWKNTW